MLRGNQHGGCEYDDLQNWLDMTSHENPLITAIYDVNGPAYLMMVNVYK